MPQTDVCGSCNKPIRTSTSLRVIRSGSVATTVFQCVSATCPKRYHVACIRDELGSDSSVQFKCTLCNTMCTAKAPRGTLKSIVSWCWIAYPTLINWRSTTFVLRRVCDLAALFFGLLALTGAYALAPYLDDASGEWPGQINRTVAENIVYNEMPAELEALRAQASDQDKPTLAFATIIASWIVGWMFISMWCGTVNLVWSLIRRKYSYQVAKGVILE